MTNHLLILQKRVFKSASISVQRRLSFSSDIKQRICVVGAGAAGYYASQYILKRLPNAHIDVIEKLPVPYGLVRFGVAPDHPEVKNVINTFKKTAEDPRVRFFGNVSLGQDVSLKSLRERYHAVLLAYGADEDRKLNIPNEDHNNITSARDFVAWYNGLPGAENLKPNLSGESVAIIGQGNVAMDVARILLSPIDVLKKTDITSYSLEALSASKVKRVYMIGRRGPLQAAFTIKELREMLTIPDVVTQWRQEDFAGVAEALPNLPRPKKRITELMLKSSSETVAATSGKKQFLPIFMRSPKQFLPPNQIELTVNVLEGNSAVATDATEVVDSDLLLRSIGYKSVKLDEDINFDERNGRVINENGRVLKNDNSIDPGLYTAGWLATGPTGVILTTMNNSFSVADGICKDFHSGFINCNDSKPGIDTSGLNVVDWSSWIRIDEAEMAEGVKRDKLREKFVDISKMINFSKS